MHQDFQRISLMRKGEVGRQRQSSKHLLLGRSLLYPLAPWLFWVLPHSTYAFCSYPEQLELLTSLRLKKKGLKLHTLPQLLTSSAEQPRLKSSHHTSQVDGCRANKACSIRETEKNHTSTAATIQRCKRILQLIS